MRLTTIQSLLVVSVLLAMAGNSAIASQVRQVNLEEMTDQAATIFSGRCIEVEIREDAALGHPIVVASFEVDRLVKGEAGDRIEIRMPATGAAGAGRGIAGTVRFREGEEVVLFLYDESELGLRSPVGLGQGKFSIVEDKLGRRFAINEFGNKNLTRGMSAQARGRLEDSFAEVKDWREVEASTLLDLAHMLRP